MESQSFSINFHKNLVIRDYFENATVKDILNGVISSVEMRKNLIENLNESTCMFDSDPYLSEESISYHLYTNYYLKGQGDQKIIEILSPSDVDRLLDEYDIKSFGYVEIPSGLQSILIEEILQTILRKRDWEEDQFNQIFGFENLSQIRQIVYKYEQQLQQFINLTVVNNGLRFQVVPIWKRGPITVQIKNEKNIDYESLEDFSRQVLLRKYIKTNLTAMDGCSHDASQWLIQTQTPGKLIRILDITTTFGSVGKIYVPFNNWKLCREIPPEMLNELRSVCPIFSFELGKDLKWTPHLKYYNLIINPFGPWNHYNDNLRYLQEPSSIFEYYYRRDHLPNIIIPSDAINKLKQIAKLLKNTIGNSSNFRSCDIPFLIQSLICLPPICIEKYEKLLRIDDFENLDLIGLIKLLSRSKEVNYETSILRYKQRWIKLNNNSLIHLYYWVCRILVGELSMKLYDFDDRRILVSTEYPVITRDNSISELINSNQLTDLEQLIRINQQFKQYFEIYDEPRAIPYEKLFMYPQKITLQDLNYLVRILNAIPASYLEKYEEKLSLQDIIYEASTDLTVSDFFRILTRTSNLICSTNNITRDDILEKYGVSIQTPESWVLFLQYQDKWIASTASVVRTDLHRFLVYIFRQELNEIHNDILTQEPCDELGSLRSHIQ